MQTDPRIKAFQNRAAAIVAASQGLTPECLQQLEMLARQLRLEPAEWQDTLEQLRDQVGSETPLNRYEEAFRKEAVKQLESRSGRILSLGREAGLLEIAARKYQLGQIRANQLLESVCLSLDIRRISRTDAEASFRQLAEELIGSDFEARLETVSQLIDAGRGWGLDESSVQSITGQIARKNVQRRNRRLRRLAKSAVILAVAAGLLSWLVQWSLQRDWRTNQPVVNPEPLETASPSFPAWWPESEVRDALAGLPGAELWQRRLDKVARLDASLRSQALLEISSEASLADSPAAMSLAAALAEIAKRQGLSESRLWLEPLVDSSENDRLVLPAGRSSMHVALKRITFVQQLFRLLPDEKTDPEPGSDPQVKRVDSRPAEASDLLQSWWELLMTPGVLTPQRLASTLESLREVSLPIMEQDQLAAWHGEALERQTSKGQPIDEALLGEIAWAMDHDSQDSLSGWMRRFQQAAPGPGRDQLGVLVLKRAVPGIAIGSPQEAELRIGELARNALENRHPGLFEANRSADISLQMARQLKDSPEQEPAAIAMSAQSVNDALLVLAWLPKSTGAEQSQQPGFIVAAGWRYDPLSVGEEQGSTGDDSPAARATAADLRTLNETMAELAGFATAPERTSHRRTALENLLRIAPRLSDLAPEKARLLADYYLAELTVEEWLQAEKYLPGFRFWPGFLLALADAIPDSRVSADQGISITQLTAAGKFEPNQAQNWRVACGEVLANSAVVLLEDRLANTTAKRKANWNLCRVSLQSIYRYRTLLVSDPTELAPISFPSGEGIAASLAAVLLEGSSRSLLESGPDSARGPARELSDVVRTAGLCGQAIVQRLESGFDPALLEDPQLRELRVQVLESGKAAGELSGQLLLIEVNLLEYLTRLRQLMLARFIAS